MTNSALQHITYSIYKCLDCLQKRALTCIPAVIDGVVNEEKIPYFCSQCDSDNVKVLFETKSADEFSVYCQIINLEDEGEK